MKKSWSVFIAGFLAGALSLGAALALTQTPPAEAQAQAGGGEQLQVLRDMSWTLKGIEQALQRECP